VTQDGDFLLFEGNRYDRRGFLYKGFVMSAIVSKYVISLYMQFCTHWRLHKYFISLLLLFIFLPVN